MALKHEMVLRIENFLLSRAREGQKQSLKAMRGENKLSQQSPQ
jgi:hypothetical protein